MCALVGVVSGNKAEFAIKMSFELDMAIPALGSLGSIKFLAPWKTWNDCNTEVGGPSEPTDPVIIENPFSVTPGNFSVTGITEDFSRTQGEQTCTGNHDSDFGWYMKGTAGANSFCNQANTSWSMQVWMGPGVTDCSGNQTATFSGNNLDCSSGEITMPLPAELKAATADIPASAGVTISMKFLLAIKGACNVSGQVTSSETFPNAVEAASAAKPGLSKSTSSSSSSVCFPAQSTLQLDNGNMVRMDALQVGHKVQVGAKEYSEVFMFSHQFTDAQATFVELTTATGAIRLTPGHYLYVNGAATQARAVKVGDHLEAANGTPAVVTGVTQVRDTGLYNPHTMHGDVVVNGFRTTTYTDAIHPTMAHALLAPARAMYAMNVTF
jgi:hypothetical protein